MMNATLRVLVVGNTGLEGQLRKDATIELVRCRSALEMLGELSEPVDEYTPGQSVVIVAPSIESTLVVGELQNAIRVLNPSARLLLAVEGRAGDRGFDATIAPGSDGRALRDILAKSVQAPLPLPASPFAKLRASKGQTLDRRDIAEGGDGSDEASEAVRPEVVKSKMAKAADPGFVISSGLPGMIKTIRTGKEDVRDGAANGAGVPGQSEPSDHRTSGMGMRIDMAAPVLGGNSDVGIVGISTPMPSSLDVKNATVLVSHEGVDAAVMPPALPVVVPARAQESAKGDGREGDDSHTHFASRTARQEQAKAGMSALGDPLLRESLAILRGQAATGPSPVRVRSAGDDRELTGALLAGQDVLWPAVALLRVRLNDQTIEFHPAGVAAAHGQLATVRAGGIGSGRVLGHLVGQACNAGEIESAAIWLGQWLALRDHQVELRRVSQIDELTGAYNRAYLERFLPAAIAEANSQRRSISILLFDIDHFKHFNDAHGHAAGDEILVDTVRLLRSVVRPDDRVCRVGGDEFVVVFYEPQGPREPASRHPSDIQALAARFQARLAQHTFPRLGADAVRKLTVSGGLATFPWDGHTMHELIEHADRTLLAAKRSGRNVITFGATK